MSTKTLLTVEEFAELEPPPGVRYELDAGELVVMTFPTFEHNFVAERIYHFIYAYLRRNPVGRVLFPDSGFLLSSGPDTLRGPDVSFLTKARLELVDRKSNQFEGAPDLAVEVVSPSDRASSLQRKVRQYLAAGGSVVWVVYPEAQEVYVHESDGSVRVLRSGDTLDCPRLLPGFSVLVSELFEDLL